MRSHVLTAALALTICPAVLLGQPSGRVQGTFTVTADKTNVMLGDRVVATATKGQVLDVRDEVADWWSVTLGGWVRKTDGVFRPTGGLTPTSQPTVRFFGIQTTRPDRVIYVMDKSGSMLKTFDLVRQELIRSINDLDETQQFHVILFADNVPTEFVVGKRPAFQPANAANKKALAAWMEDKVPASTAGLTDPQASMKRALALAEAEQWTLVYLLTDGMFPDDTLKLLRTLNAGKKVIVHTILFGEDNRPDGKAEKLLRAIAEENGGTFRFIPEKDLENER